MGIARGKRRGRKFVNFAITAVLAFNRTAASACFDFQCFLRWRDQVLHPGGRASGSVGGGSKLSGWGGSVEERDSAMEFVSGGWEGREFAMNWAAVGPGVVV